MGVRHREDACAPGAIPEGRCEVPSPTVGEPAQRNVASSGIKATSRGLRRKELFARTPKEVWLPRFCHGATGVDWRHSTRFRREMSLRDASRSGSLAVRRFGISGTARLARGVSDEAARLTKRVSDEAARLARWVSDEAARRAGGVSEEAARRARGISEEAARRAGGQRRGRLPPDEAPGGPLRGALGAGLPAREPRYGPDCPGKRGRRGIAQGLPGKR
jgi:hypothetical protein